MSVCIHCICRCVCVIVIVCINAVSVCSEATFHYIHSKNAFGYNTKSDTVKLSRSEASGRREHQTHGKHWLPFLHGPRAGSGEEVRPEGGHLLSGSHLLRAPPSLRHRHGESQGWSRTELGTLVFVLLHLTGA